MRRMPGSARSSVVPAGGAGVASGMAPRDRRARPAGAGGGWPKGMRGDRERQRGGTVSGATAALPLGADGSGARRPHRSPGPRAPYFLRPLRPRAAVVFLAPPFAFGGGALALAGAFLAGTFLAGLSSASTASASAPRRTPALRRAS